MKNKRTSYTNKEIDQAKLKRVNMSNSEYNQLWHQTTQKTQQYLESVGVAKSFRDIKKLPRIKIKGKDVNGKERLIAREIRMFVGSDEIEKSEGFNTFLPLIKEGVINYETETDKRYLYFEVQNENDKFFDLLVKEYIFKSGKFYLHFKTVCTQVSKKTPFYESYKGEIYDTIRIIKGKENYLETEKIFSLDEWLMLMHHFTMTDEELTEERFVITSYAFAVFKCINYLFELSTSSENDKKGLLDNGKTIKNNDYFELINWSESIFDCIPNMESIKYNEGWHIIKKNTIRNTIIDIVNSDKVSVFNCAVGYVASSGLALLREVYDKIAANNGKCKLIVGGLQNYPNIIPKSGIDQKTAVILNMLIIDQKLELFTHDKSFYHGKVYCLEGEKFHYYIVGSSNISVNAFKNNYEMDILYIAVPESEKDIELKKWYTQLENECKRIPYLDEDKFENNSINDEESTKIQNDSNEISFKEAKNIIDELSDEDTKFRLNAWLKYGPIIYQENVIDIPALKGYTMFVYKDNEMVVFESFRPQNRYYVFGMPNGVDDLMLQLRTHTKNQMVNSEYYVDRGNHVKNKQNILAKIDRLFI